jgi:4-amino-4-deoxy-L-arabinose transferase-like glycosyltransferase
VKNNTTPPNFLFTGIVLFALWVFATAFNLDKAYHVDDAAYVQIAKWIAQHPLHPMSGLLRWGADSEPIHFLNQPPLYCYLMAAWGSFFGWSEIAMHALLSIFTLWAILAFYRLARIVTPEAALLPTVLFALSPAFVLSQNTMFDVPLVAVWIEFFRVLLDPKVKDRWRYLLSGLLCALALLIKYTSLVLLPALLLHILFVSTLVRLIWIVLPLGVLLAWSGFNYWEYGGVHLAGRPVAGRSLISYFYSSFYWISVLGAITPFAGFYFYAQKSAEKIKSSRIFWQGVLALFFISYVVLCVWMFVSPPRHMINVVLQAVFLLTGMGLVLILILILIKNSLSKHLRVTDWMLLYWILSTAGFIVVLAPFMAVRHVLLALPPVLLLLHSWIGAHTKAWIPRTTSIVMTALLTVALVSADRWYADIYRQQASLIRASLPPDSNIWYNSNWGWQWYAEQAGMKLFSNLPTRSMPEPGDYFVSTQSACCALPLPKSLKLEPIETIVIERTARMQRLASITFYASGLQTWGYSYEPIERFQISRVISNKN